MANINICLKRGSVTVEAAYIVPVILLITIAFLYAIMMGYDRGVAYLELRRCSEILCSNDCADSKDKNKDVNIEYLQKKMLVYHIDYIDIENSNSKVAVHGHMSCKIFRGKFGSCNIYFKQKKINECKNMRRIVFQNG